MATEPKNVPERDVPEVSAYLEEKEYLADYCAQKAEVVATLRCLIERVNTAAQAADKAVRALGVYCGPWQKHNVKTEIDLELLLERLGPDKFQEIGGKVVMKPTYEIDRKRLDLAIAKREIPAEVAEEVIKRTYSYKKVEPLKL